MTRPENGVTRVRISIRGRTLASLSATALAASLLAAAPAHAAGAVYDPVPESQVQSPLGLVLEEYASAIRT